jgi:hypothetical protein
MILHMIAITCGVTTRRGVGIADLSETPASGIDQIELLILS